MKKQILFIAVIIATIFGLKANAQVSVNLNIGSQPLWGPTGYDYVQFYYIPDIDAYYDVSRHEYVYAEGGRWVYHRTLPPRYGNYDLYNGYKVVVNEPSPWMHHDRYVHDYASYRGRHGQPFIRDSRDERYYANPHHPQHNVWVSHHATDAPRQVMPPRGNNHVPPGHVNNPGHDNHAPHQEQGHPGGPGNGHEGHGNGHEGGGHEDHGHGEGHR